MSLAGRGRRALLRGSLREAHSAAHAARALGRGERGAGGAEARGAPGTGCHGAGRCAGDHAELRLQRWPPALRAAVARARRRPSAQRFRKNL